MPEKHVVDEVRARLSEALSVHQELLDSIELHRTLADLANRCLAALRQRGKVIFAGNGGSFADAQHLSAEFTSRFMFDRAPLASVALGTNSSSMSAIGNDYGYDQVFARELQAIAVPGDMFIPISTSGNSANIIGAVEAARTVGIATVGLTGRKGGKLAQLCDCIRVPSDDTARIQEAHITIGHVLCGLIEDRYFRAGRPA